MNRAGSFQFFNFYQLQFCKQYFVKITTIQKLKVRKHNCLMLNFRPICFRFAEKCLNFCIWPPILSGKIALSYLNSCCLALSFQDKQGKNTESVKEKQRKKWSEKHRVMFLGFLRPKLALTLFFSHKFVS